MLLAGMSPLDVDLGILGGLAFVVMLVLYGVLVRGLVRAGWLGTLVRVLLPALGVAVSSVALAFAMQPWFDGMVAQCQAGPTMPDCEDIYLDMVVIAMSGWLAAIGWIVLTLATRLVALAARALAPPRGASAAE